MQGQRRSKSIAASPAEGACSACAVQRNVVKKCHTSRKRRRDSDCRRRGFYVTCYRENKTAGGEKEEEEKEYTLTARLTDTRAREAQREHFGTPARSFYVGSGDLIRVTAVPVNVTSCHVWLRASGRMVQAPGSVQQVIRQIAGKQPDGKRVLDEEY